VIIGTQVNAACNLSPGKHTQKRLNQLDKKRNVIHENPNTYKKKMERLKLKEQRQSSELYSEICEGKTYESNEDFSSKTSRPDDLVEIPATIGPQVHIRPINRIENGDTPNIVIADLETTGFCTYSFEKRNLKNI
jgi:hypothetical protein